MKRNNKNIMNKMGEMIVVKNQGKNRPKKK